MNETKLIPKKSGTFKSFDGTEIYYEVRGEGEPMIFIYGIACLMNHWHFQVEYFSRTHQVITFDIRGHHKSGVSLDEKNNSIEAIAKDMPFLFKELEIQRAIFVGHSFGVPALLKTFEQHPELVKSMCFINGFAKNPIKGMFGLDVIEPFFYMVKDGYKKNPKLIDKIWKVAVDNPITALSMGIVGGFNLNVTQFKDVEIYVRGVANMPLSVFISFFEDMMNFKGDYIARKINVPTLIVSGDKDMVTPQHFQHELHAEIKHSELTIVPYGSHCTQLDFPEFVNLRLEKFLSENN